MLIRRRVMTTQEANALTLPPGRVVEDIEAHALRIHDGVTPGGFVIPTTEVEFPTGPGPTTLQAGDMNLGFYGETTDGVFIDYASLASKVGLSQGTVSWPTNEWFKIAYQNKTLFYPKQPARHTLSWESIYQAGCVYGVDGPGPYPYPTSQPVNQRTVIEYLGRYYLVRLMKGTNRDDGLTTVSYSGSQTHPEVVDSEWNKFFYPLVDGRWANYTEVELRIGGSISGSGASTPVQETESGNPDGNLFRGFTSKEMAIIREKASADGGRGWRPVLELLP